MPPSRPRRPRHRAKKGPARRTGMRTVIETSAGGLVVQRDANGVPSAALIARRARNGELVWSLPKGHIEEGETAEDAAIREVAEETGIIGEVIEPLGTIDFWFVAEGRRIHKTVHHFLMLAAGGEISADDVEVAEVEWVLLSELPQRLAYDDERELAGRASELLARTA